MYVVPFICCSCIYDNVIKKTLYEVKKITQDKRNNMLFYMAISKIANSSQDKKILDLLINDKRQHVKNLEQFYRIITRQNIIPLQESMEKPSSYIEGLRMCIISENKAIMNCNQILTFTQDIRLKTIISNILSDELKHLGYFHSLYTENRIKAALCPVKLYREMKELTLEELAEYDGSGGKSAYVAVEGVIYDVSNNPLWGGGTHFGLYAGRDLTSQFNTCHNMKAILEKLPKIGILKSK